ncbi:MAG: histidine phosphatase family protein [Xanthobacteraceae bacterium]
MKQIVRLASLGVLALLWSLPASSTALAQAEWIAAVRGGGHVIIFRHGATHRDQADTDPLNLKNVAQQRQLNDQGRELARSIGDAMRKLKIPVGLVHTSMFYRAVETGTLLGFGSVTSSADFTEGGQVVTPIENDRRAAAMRKFASTLPPAGTNIVLVSHKPNIMDAFGKDWFDIREGEASIFKPDGSGAHKLVARVQASEWAKLAASSN